MSFYARLGYDSALEKQDILTPAMARVSVEGTMLSEASQSLQCSSMGFLLTEGVRVVQFVQTESRAEERGRVEAVVEEWVQHFHWNP